MLLRKMMMKTLPLAFGLMAMVGGYAQAQTLTAEDYAEIRNIAQYYNLGYDSVARADGGAVVARSFTPDMAFTRDGGPNWFSPKEMGDYAAKATNGTHHWDSNLVIEPAPEGARLFRYTLVYRVDDTGSPVVISTAGTLQEVLVKTPEGWFIKTRYNRSVGGQRPVEFPRFEGRPIAPSNSSVRMRPTAGHSASRSAPSKDAHAALSALDYIEIEMLYGWNNIALDSAAEKGEMFARTFTPDGSLQSDGRTVTGRKNLAELAARGEPAMRRWLSNLYIEPSPEGAIGWAYIVTVGGLGVTGTTPRPAIESGALYRDVLVKTPEGWRFKSRTSTPGNGVSPALPLPKVR
jgi:hypothetical protein